MPDIKLKDGNGVEQTYTDVNTITIPLADGSGLQKFSSGDWFDGTLDFSNNVNSELQGKIGEKVVKEYKGNITCTNITNMQYFMDSFPNGIYDCSNIDIYFKDNISSPPCYALWYMKKLPRLHGNPVFTNSGSNAIRNGPIYSYCASSEEAEKMCENFPSMAQVLCGGDQIYSWNSFTYLPQPWLDAPKYYGYNTVCSTWCPYYYISNYSYKNLERIEGLGLIPKLTSGSFAVVGVKLKHFTFETEEDGSPKEADWSGITIYLGSSGTNPGLGHWNYSYLSYVIPQSNFDTTFRTSYYVFSDHVITNTDIYEAYKDYDDAVVCISTENKDNAIKSLFTHDSMVETIKSLPKVTGTCTLCINKYLGGYSKLTEDEIQIATDKGWTVTSR